MQGLLSGKHGTTKGLLVLTIGAVVGLSVVSLLYAGARRATGVYDTRKQFVEEHIPDGSTLKLRTVVVFADVKERITEMYGVESVDDSIGYVLGRADDGRITGACVFVERALEPHEEPHHVAVAMTPAGAVAAVALIGAHGEYARTLQTPRFLSQFARANPPKGYRLGRDIDAVSGATMSCDLVVDVVNMVVGVFRESVVTVPGEGETG